MTCPKCGKQMKTIPDNSGPGFKFLCRSCRYSIFVRARTRPVEIR